MKPNHKIAACLYFFLSSIVGIPVLQAQETKLMTEPAISATKIAFIYAEDLWVANKDGSNPKRITVDEGIESFPVFSPDGKHIAFTAEYDGNTDVFIVSAEGGVPKRLTWHPYGEILSGFTKDGKHVIFASQRNAHTNRLAKLYTVPVTGGAVTELDIPNGFWATYSDDNSSIAYTPLSEAFTQWKHYRGGRTTRIWVYNNKSKEVVEIPKPKEGSNDTQPQWMGDYVYFRSDRNGEFNLYSYQTKTKQITQLTDYKDFPVINLKGHQGELIFEQAGTLHIYNTRTTKVTDLNLTIKADLLEHRPRFVSGANYVRSATVSPSGARIVVDFRGEVITIPADKGVPTNLTETSGVHEKFPSWSPNGRKVAYFSDASGEYALHIKELSSNEVTKIDLTGTGFYANIHWSPNNEFVSYVDNGRNLYITNIASKKTTKIAQDILFVPGDIRDLFSDWSYDSNWISYTLITETNFEKAFVYQVNENKSYAISDGMSNVTHPIFDPSGKYLYLLASTDAGPLVNWFDQSNIDKEQSYTPYLITLQKDTPSPLASENDDEVLDKKEKAKQPDTLVIDWDGIENRMISLPITAGLYSSLKAPKEGELYYLKSSYHNAPTMLHHFSLTTRKDKPLLPVNAYEITADTKSMLYLSGRSWFVSPLGAKSKKGPINLNSISVKIDPKEEWTNIFNEAWRVNRDYFYDPGMHGVDWNAMKKKYEPFIAHVSCRADLYRVMQWMFSELVVGHHRFSSRGDRMQNPKRIPVGLLGADFSVRKNRYQITRILGRLNWTPELRSPLTEPGVAINEGDFIISVNGKNVTTDENLYSFFENTANKPIAVTVSTNANGKDARTYQITPIASEFAIRNRAWIEGNIQKVHKATNGKVAYVYVPNTTTAGFNYFKRYFYPQANKDAVIIDDRFNGGGSLADYYIDILKRPLQAGWNFRYGQDLKSPSASIQGPKVMLVNEHSSSGGDYLPWMFKRFKMGTIIGKRTWGGLVGVLGYPEFIDGGIVTAPNVAFYSEKGYRVENEGVTPDIDVEQLPKLVSQGKDPQLDKAIEVILEQLKKNPPQKLKRPPYPVRTRN